MNKLLEDTTPLEDLAAMVEYIATATKLATLSSNLLVQKILVPDNSDEFYQQLSDNYSAILENITTFSDSKISDSNERFGTEEMINGK